VWPSVSKEAAAINTCPNGATAASGELLRTELSCACTCMYNKCRNVKSLGRPNDINFFTDFLLALLEAAINNATSRDWTGRHAGDSGPARRHWRRLIELTSIMRWVRHCLSAVIDEYAPKHACNLRPIIGLLRRRTQALWPLFSCLSEHGRWVERSGLFCRSPLRSRDCTPH